MKKLIVSVLAGAVLAVPFMGGQADAKTKVGPWCKALKKQPAYSYRYQGAKVKVPAGRVLVKEVRYKERACKALVKEYRAHKKKSKK